MYYHDGAGRLAAPEPATAVAERPEPAAAVSRSTRRAPRPLRRVAGTVLLGVLVAVAGVLSGRAAFGWFSSAHSLTTPARIGALELQSVPVSGAVHALSQQGWAQVRGGDYGSAGVVQMLLLTGRPPDAMTAEASLAQGLATTLVDESLVFNPRTSNDVVVNGTHVVCGPAAAAAATVSVCAWTDGDAAGIVVDYSGEVISQTRERAALARAAAEH